MAFRSSDYLQRNKLVRFQIDDIIRSPGNNQHQIKNGYKFTINDRSSFYDWYNAYFEVQFQLQKLAEWCPQPYQASNDQISWKDCI